MPDVKHFNPDAALGTVERLFWRQGMASTGIQEIVTATGVNRSSLYATFGGKKELYLAALRRYVQHRSLPMFERLASDPRGLPAIAEFFTRLIETRCSGEFAGWGCMASNAHAGAESGDPDVQRILDQHYEQLRAAMRAALTTAAAQGQLRDGVAPDATGDTLALLAYGVNLRSRAGADAQALLATVAGTLASISTPRTATEEST